MCVVCVCVFVHVVHENFEKKIEEFPVFIHICVASHCDLSTSPQGLKIDNSYSYKNSFWFSVENQKVFFQQRVTVSFRRYQI